MTNKANNISNAAVNAVSKKIKNTVSTHSLLDDRDSVLVALSGGADSVCLLHALYFLRKELGITVYAAHLNHGIRGAEADADEAYVKELCEDLGITLFCESADVPRFSKDNGLSEEEAGRRLRYEFFARVCAKNKIGCTATAHNKNDRAETILMRIIRGSGLSGLSGIKYKREDGIIRPLLDVTRGEIEAYCREAGLEYRTDSTNADDNYTRNRVRHKVLPLLESEFNPNIVSALTGLSDKLTDDAEFIDAYAKRLYERLRPPLRHGKFKAMHIDSLKLIGQRSIVSRLIRLCASDVMGHSCSLESKHIEAVFKIIDGNSAGAELPGGLNVRSSYGWLEFYKKSDGEILNSYYNSEFCVEVEPNKSYNIEKAGFRFFMTIIDKNAYQKQKGDILLDADKLGLCGGNTDNIDNTKFKLRSRIEGDRITVFKSGGKKKVKKIFIDKKIPANERNRIPLLCRGDEILAVLGIRVSELYRPKRNTINYLVVSYEKYED